MIIISSLTRRNWEGVGGLRRGLHGHFKTPTFSTLESHINKWEIKIFNKLSNTMPTLGPSTGPKQWESFHLDKSYCLACNEVNK